MAGLSLSLGLSLGSSRVGGGFSPSALFAASEPGAWYDPSDLSTMFQDSAGTVPVTATGQTVGLVLDKSKGLALGPELVTNGDFSGGTTGWTLGANWSVGSGVASKTAGAANNLSQSAGIVNGRFYRVSFVLTISGGTIWVNVGSSGAFSNAQTVGGTISLIVAANGTTGAIEFQAGSGAVVTIDNISVKELPGNHATQATAASRPILRTGSRIDYDGVDDFLRSVLPNLGTNATLVRAVQGVGTTILTGQTIASGNYDDNIDHCGLLLINRALTAGETAQITAFMNKKAGF